MARFQLGRCSECEKIVVLMRDGNVARHYRLYQTHGHAVVKQACLGFGFPPLGAPVVIEATTSRRARQLARGEQR
jgi:hypothetical protein